MFLKKLSYGVLMAMIFTKSAFAMDLDFKPYIGLDVNGSQISSSDALGYGEEDFNFGAVGVKLGADFTDFLGAEIRVGVGVLNDENTYNDGFDTIKDEVSMNDYVASFVKLQTPEYNGFRLKGLAGVARVDLTDDYEITNGFGSTTSGKLTDHETGFAYGAGVSYAITDQISTDLEYLKLHQDIDTINLGVSYHF